PSPCPSLCFPLFPAILAGYPLAGGFLMTLSLTATGEIATFRDVDQFQPAKTQFACGFFSCALVKAMAPVGQVATQTVAEMIAEAEQWYAQVNGDASISNTDGMTLQE